MNTVSSCTIGLDMGTSTIKAIAFDATGTVMAHAAAEVTTRRQDDCAEQDPLEVYEQCVKVLAQATQAAQAQGHSVVRIGVSAAMHSILAVRADGFPLTPALLWMDARAREQAKALWSSPAGKALYARTGTPIHAMSPLAKLLWLRERQPEIWQQAAKFVSLKEWIWQRWFGDWQVDTSIASATGLYCTETEKWDDEALALAGVSPGRLSALVPTTLTRQVMHVPDLLAAGLTSETSLTVGASDGVLANLGVQAITPDALVLTIGTSCAVRRGSSRPFTNPETRSFCYVLDREHFIIGSASNSGGAVLDWALRLVQGSDSDAAWTDLLQATSNVQSGGLVCVPYLAGERAPLWDATASGTFWGLRLNHQPAHVIRAVIEGILFNARWIAEDLIARDSPPQRLIATGKVLATPWIQQLLAEIFRLPVYDGSQSDASARGAAMLADIAARQAVWPNRLPTADPSAVPSATPRYESQYAQFKHLARLGADADVSGA